MKKIYWFLLSFFTVIYVLICFGLGYQLPEKNLHKDWVFFAESKDAAFEIEKTGIKAADFMMVISNNLSFCYL